MAAINTAYVLLVLQMLQRCRSESVSRLLSANVAGKRSLRRAVASAPQATSRNSGGNNPSQVFLVPFGVEVSATEKSSPHRDLVAPSASPRQIGELGSSGLLQNVSCHALRRSLTVAHVASQCFHQKRWPRLLALPKQARRKSLREQ